MSARVRRWTGLLGVVAFALLSAGCISSDYVSSIGNIDATSMLRMPQVKEIVGIGYRLGLKVLPAMLVILCFILYHDAQAGKPWTGLLKDGLYWSVGCVLLMGTFSAAAGGFAEWTYQASQEVCREFQLEGGAPAGQYQSVSKAFSKFMFVVRDRAPVASPQTQDGADGLGQFANAWWFAQMHPSALGWSAVNASALPVMRFFMNVSQVVLVVFYWSLTPLVLPMMVLPQTRGIFVGWLKSYVGVCLWPLFFNLIERLSAALPWGEWCGAEKALATFQAGAGVERIVEAVGYWTRGQFVMFALNLTFLLMYLTVPIIAGRIVNGASSAVKAGFF